MRGRIMYKNMLRTLDPDSTDPGWTDTGRLTDDQPGLCAMATGYSGSSYALIYDLGAVRTGTGCAVINHNMPDIGATFFMVYTGSTDNGTTWDELRLIVGSMTSFPAYTPSFSGRFSASATKRWWKFLFAGSSSASVELHVGQVCLFNATADLPTAPSSPRSLAGDDCASDSRSLGGYEGRREDGPAYWQRQLRWEKEPGGVGVWTQVRDILRYARRHAQWDFEPVAWVEHSADKPNPVYEAHPCSFCTIEGVADSEVLNDGSTRRFDVSFVLKELTFDGLL